VVCSALMVVISAPELAQLADTDTYLSHQMGVRYEDEKTTVFLDEWHVRDYRAPGYDVVRVLAVPPAERAALVMGKLANLKII